MAQRPGGSTGNDLVAKVRAWFEERLHGILHGPEVGPERAQGGTSQDVEPEPSEAAREERGRRDAGVAEDAQELDERSTSLAGQPIIDTVKTGTEVVTETESDQPDQASETSQSGQAGQAGQGSRSGDSLAAPQPTLSAQESASDDEGEASEASPDVRSYPESGASSLSQSGPATLVEETDVSGDQHSLTAEPADAVDTASVEGEPELDEDDAAATAPQNQHDMQSFEPPLDSIREEDVQTSAAESATADAASSRDEAVAWAVNDAGVTPQGTSTGASGLPEGAEEFPASETATEDDVQADAETGSTWAPVHGDTSYDEMTREPVENAGGQTAAVVPDVGGVTGTAGATNLDDSAGAPAEMTGLDDIEAQVSDLRDRPPSETDFPDELANDDTPEGNGDYVYSGSKEEAAGLQFGGANEELGFGTFDSRPEEVEEAGSLAVAANDGDSPEEYDVPSGVTEIVPDSDDADLAGDAARDVNADETGGGTNIAAAAAVVDADAREDSPRGSVRGDGTATCPTGYPIKGNASSKIYHVPGVSSYNATKAEVCFATEDDAVAAGYRAPRGR